MCTAVRRRPRGEGKQKGPIHWGGKTQKTWLAAWQRARQRDLYPPDPPKEGICESLKKNVYFFMPQMIKQSVIKYEGIFSQSKITANIFNHYSECSVFHS